MQRRLAACCRRDAEALPLGTSISQVTSWSVMAGRVEGGSWGEQFTLFSLRAFSEVLFSIPWPEVLGTWPHFTALVSLSWAAVCPPQGGVCH